MNTPEAVTQGEFARRIGCKPGYVTDLKKNDRLVMTPDGRRVLVEASIARIHATRDPSKAGVAERHAAQRGSALASPTAPAGGSSSPHSDEQDPEINGDADTEENPRFQTWKARRERAAALREEIKLTEEAGEYLRRDEAVGVVSQAFVATRAALESMPDSIAPMLAMESDQTRVRAILIEEFEHVLGNLSNDIAALQRPQE